MDKLTFYAPIAKTDDEQKMVYGYASTEALDSQGEVVKKEALSKAIDDYMKWANIREMHQPSAVGKTKKAQIDKKGLYIAAKIVDSKAWEKVKEGVYSGFSIGGRVGVMKDNEITALTLSEISLVDRPANPECVIDVYKADNMKTDKKVTKSETTPAEEVKPVVETKPVEEKKEEVKPVVTTTTTDVVVEVKPEPAKTIVEAVVEAKEKVSKPSLIKIDDICKKEEFEKIKNPEMKKCLEYVAELAIHLNNLHDMEERYESEEKWEASMQGKTGEEMSKEYTALVDALKALGEVLKSLATKAVEEMVAEEKDEVAPEATPIVMADTKNDVEKVGKEISAKNAKTITDALASLQAAVKALSDLGVNVDERKQLTPDEEEKLRNGVSAGSERTSGGHLGEKPLQNPDTTPNDNTKSDKPVVTKSEVADAKEVAKVEAESKLAKVEAELSTLKEQFAKLQNLPLPIKAKASYVTVEKFDGGNKTAELQKAEGRMETLSKLLALPHDATLEKEAKDLSLTIMRLRRETAGSNH